MIQSYLQISATYLQLPTSTLQMVCIFRNVILHRKINNINIMKYEQVKDLSISFMTQKMKVTFEEGVDEDAVMANVLKAAKKVESDFEIL